MHAIYFYLLILVHPYLAMWWKSFPQAGRSSWEAMIPVYNYYVAFKIGCKKPFWSLLLIFPGVHLAMLAVVNVSYIRRFGYYSLIDTLQGIVFPYIIMAKIASSKKDILPETNWANSKEMADREWGDHLALFLSLPVIGHAIALGIGAVTRHQPGKKSKVKEWGDSLIFALIAASIIRTYVFEPFQIPTGSMEKTLLVGDFLFVNKLAYGPKVPVTPLSYPLVHNTVPYVNIRSYSFLETLDYTRLPGLRDVERYDVVVFNYPSGDTAIYDPRIPDGLMGHDYHGYLLMEARKLYENSSEHGNFYRTAYDFYNDSITKVNAKRPEDNKIPATSADSLAKNFAFNKFLESLETWKGEARKFLASGKAHDFYGGGPDIEHYGLIARPVDKRENYIKRCVGIPGDWLELKSSVLYINGKKAKVFPNQNLRYWVAGFDAPSISKMQETFGLEKNRGGTQNGDYYQASKVQKDKEGNVVYGPDGNPMYVSGYMINATADQIKKLRSRYPDNVFELDLEPQYCDQKGYMPSALEKVNNMDKFPKDPNINNTTTDFVRFQVPKKGQTVKLTKENIAWYRRIITAYERHTLVEKNGGFYIDGKKATTYTFKMNYYWMMGDNRYNSADSRVWGFVPEDHIVGKASMVWFSKDPYMGIRWERMFSLIK